MHLGIAFLGCALVLAGSLPLSRTVWAQSAPQLQLQADGDASVGDIVHLTLSATSADEMPSDAQLGKTPGFVVRGQSASPSQTHIIMNGTRMDRYTLTVTWALQAQRVGTFRIGPASVQVGGARYSSPPETMTVVAPGQTPRRRGGRPFPGGAQSPFGLSPFDLWKGFMQGFDTNPQPPAPTPEIVIDPKLSLDAPRGAARFLHATVDKSSAVVGEQVTYSVYLYVDATTGIDLRREGEHDPAIADFAKHPLFREDQEEPPEVGFASVGGRTWGVSLLRRWALFPLHAGDLTIGPMQLDLVRPGSTGDAVRTTETLQVHTIEPPAAGRPPGYALGDVGHLSLSADVSPRQIEQGGAIAVHVEVKGTGNIPSALAAPARDGVEWLAPEVKEELGATSATVFGGKRTFDYVVRVHRSGSIALGELALPFWDPDQRRYEVARAPLGSVDVSPSAAEANASTAPPVETLPGLPAARAALEGSPAARPHLDDSPAFWIIAIGASPAVFGLAVAGRALAGRVVGARRRRRESPAADLRDKLTMAAAACRAEDARTADAAIARALEAATMAHAGVNVRGALGGEVVDRLERAGVARSAATDVAELLRECEAARFAPDAVDIGHTRDRWLRAQGAIRTLERGG
jgi:hypothetical protein